MSIFTRFARDRRGNIAMILGLAMVPIVGAVGFAIDYSRLNQIRGKLGDALDAGVLAVGSQPQMTDSKTYTAIHDWIDAHMGAETESHWHLDSVVQDTTSGKITAKVSGDVDMTLARMVGITSVPISLTSEAVRTTGKAEIALVLDNTGSMKGQKLTNLKAAATQLVDTLASTTKDPNDLRISLVPFTMTVNVGPSYKTAAWIDTTGISDANNEVFNNKVNRFDLFTKQKTTWAGCVESRKQPYDIDETTGDASKPDTLYVPYFAPDEPDTKSGSSDVYTNNYLKDTSLTTIKKGTLLHPSFQDYQLLQGDTAKYSTAATKTGTQSGGMGYKYGPNAGCEIAPLLRLSSDTSAVKTAISKMVANGNTDIPIGLAWGWNVLSPVGPFADGKPYDDQEWEKYVVLMTDGNNENDDPGGSNLDKSYYSGLAYIWQGRMGITSGTKAQRTTARDTRLGALCQKMKDAGITIYTLRVEVKTGSSNVLQDCASDPKKFYDVADSSKLTAAFQDIAGSIQKLRLAR